MTKLLEKAIAELRAFPENRQDVLAEAVLGLAAEQRRPRLTPEQIAEVELAIQEANAGKFATEEEMADTWKRFGL